MAFFRHWEKHFLNLMEKTLELKLFLWLWLSGSFKQHTFKMRYAKSFTNVIQSHSTQGSPQLPMTFKNEPFTMLANKKFGK